MAVSPDTDGDEDFCLPSDGSEPPALQTPLQEGQDQQLTDAQLAWEVQRIENEPA